MKNSKTTATPYTSPHGIPPLLLILILILTPSLLHVATAQQPSDQTSSSDGDYYPNNVNPSMAIIIVVLVLVFFITGVISLYVQCAGNSTVTPAGAAATRSQRVHSNVPRGLEPSKIESFPTFIYSSIKKLKIGKGSLECAICLSEFNDSDSLRLLTKCDHVFHSDCIDSWLAGHVTCPVCRANLAQDPTQPTPPAQPNEEFLESEVTVLNIPFKFPRSHSTGHSLVRPGDDVDRFTLRLPVDVRRQLLARAKLKRATSLVALPRATSSRRGYRAGGGEGSGSSRYGRIMGAFGLRVGSFRALGYKVGGGGGGDRDGSTSSRRVLGTPVMPLDDTLRQPSLLPL